MAYATTFTLITLGKVADPLLCENQLKEARESWDDFVTDEFVYVMEDTHGVSFDHSSAKLFNFKSYTQRKVWVELLLRFSVGVLGDSDCSALRMLVESNDIGKQRTTGTSNSIAKFGKDWGDKPVFIGVGDISEYGEEFNLRPVPSVVRLKFLDDAFRPAREVFDTIQAGSSVVSSLVKDGELNSGRPLRVTASRERKLPDDMIKGRAKIGGKVSDHKSPMWRRLALGYAISCECLGLPFGEGIWLIGKKPTNAPFESV